MQIEGCWKSFGNPQ